MKVALYGVVAIVMLVVLVTVIGYSLPQNHTASREVVLSATPETVFSILTDVGRYPEWRNDVSKVEVLSASPLKWREHAGGDVLTLEMVESQPPARLRARIADPTLPFGGEWTYDIGTQGSSTRLVITEHGEVYNPIFRFMSRFVLGHTATIDRFLRAIEKRVQSVSGP